MTAISALPPTAPTSSAGPPRVDPHRAPADVVIVLSGAVTRGAAPWVRARLVSAPTRRGDLVVVDLSLVTSLDVAARREIAVARWRWSTSGRLVVLHTGDGPAAVARWSRHLDGTGAPRASSATG